MVKKVAKYNAQNSEPTLEMAEDIQEFKTDDGNTLITGSNCYSQFSRVGSSRPNISYRSGRNT